MLDSVTDPFSKGLKSAAADAEGQSKRMASALGAVTKIGLGLGAAIVGIGAESIKMATTYESVTTRLVTSAGEQNKNLKMVQQGMLGMAGQVGTSAIDLANAMYYVESAGFHGADGLTALKSAAQGAAAEGADTTTVVKAMTDVLVDYHLKASDSADITSKMITAVSFGKTSLQDFSGAFASIVPAASAAGISFTDVSAALAEMTNHGFTANRASQNLAQALRSLLNPTGPMTKAFDRLGVSSDVLKAKLAGPDGLTDAMQYLSLKAEKAGKEGTPAFAAALKQLMGTAPGANAALATVGENFDATSKAIAGIGAASADAQGNVQGFAEIQKTLKQQLKEVEAGAQSLGIRIGDFLIPQISKLITLGQGAGGGIISGFTDSALKPVAHDNLHNAFLNEDVSRPPELTGWQRFGQEVHQVLDDVEQGAVKLEPVGRDLIRFGDDVWQSLGNLVRAAEPVAQVFGGALFLGAEAVGKALANVAGPAIKDFANFLADHQGMIRFFAEVVLGALVTKMTVLAGINAAKGVLGLATAIAQFPLQQTGQITGAWTEMKTAFAGKEAADGEKAVKGLKGAVDDLKGSVSGMLDKVPALDGLRLKLAGVKEGVAGAEKAASDTSGVEQLGTDLTTVATNGGKAATEVEAAGTAAAGMGTKVLGVLGPLGLLAGALVGVGYAAQKTGMLADHTGQAADRDLQQLGASAGMAQDAIDKFGKYGAAMAVISNESAGGAGGVQEVDKALAGMINSGHADWAKSRFDAIAASLKADGMSSIDAASKFPAYEAALTGAGNAADTMAGKVQNSIDVMQHQQLLDQFGSDLANLTQTINTNGKALSGNSVQAQQNIGAFRNLTLESLSLWKSQTDAHAPVDQVNHDLAQQYLALEGVATQFLGSKKKADDFLNSLGMIKPQYDTSIGLSTDRAVRELNGLLQTINTSYGVVQVAVNTTGLGISTSRGAATPGFDGGGFANWATGAPRLAVLHGGEYVVSNDMRAGRQPIDPRVLSGMSRGSGLTGSGSGGGGTTIVYNVSQTVEGSVLGRVELEKLVRELVQQHKNRNSTTGMG